MTNEMSRPEEVYLESSLPVTTADQRVVRGQSRLGILWSGGRAAAGVGAGIALVGFLLIRGVAGVPILGSDDEWFVPVTLLYLVGAIVLGLLATEVMRLMLASTPRPLTFFAWASGIFIAIGILLPLLVDQPLSEKIGTAFINFATMLAICVLVAISAASAIRTGSYRQVVRTKPRTYVVPSAMGRASADETASPAQQLPSTTDYPNPTPHH